MRFLPNIRYGTENYPEKVARRLRAVNISAWIAAIFAFLAFGFWVAQFFGGTPGMWKVGAIHALATLLFASAPLLHRFGPRSAALTMMFVGYAELFILISLVGTGTGLSRLYLVTAALTVVFFGAEQIVLSALFGILAVLLVIVLEALVPYNTGLLHPSAQFAGFIINTIVVFAGLLAIVFFALREAARAEENLAREYGVSQDKTRQLELANNYKSHFLASASHDLRQPLHALNLFVAQLQSESDPGERARLVGRIDAAVGSMNELFEALLDMTKLDAGVLQPTLSEFPVKRLFDRIKTTFADAARKKRLRLRVVDSDASVSSDPMLLERILLNLVSNAVRYTERGGVVVGCRRRGKELRIDVCDTGAGIPEDQSRSIFVEFYQLASVRTDGESGLGLGLAIVDRLGRLLGHAVELDSRLGRGSRFSVRVPLVAQEHVAMETAASLLAVVEAVRGKRVMVIDDDTLVLEGMRGILQSWGCHVQTAASGAAALASLGQDGGPPDLIISDYRLGDGKTGIEAIEHLRETIGVSVPAFMISGDTAPERLREARAGGFHLLHKPVSAMALRTTVNRLLSAKDARTFPTP